MIAIKKKRERTKNKSLPYLRLKITAKIHVSWRSCLIGQVVYIMYSVTDAAVATNIASVTRESGDIRITL